jgi:hypothetical protein
MYGWHGRLGADTLPCILYIPCHGINYSMQMAYHPASSSCMSQPNTWIIIALQHLHSKPAPHGRCLLLPPQQRLTSCLSCRWHAKTAQRSAAPDSAGTTDHPCQHSAHHVPPTASPPVQLLVAASLVANAAATAWWTAPCCDPHYRILCVGLCMLAPPCCCWLCWLVA